MQYTHVSQIGSKILHRWADAAGKHRSEFVNFEPTLYAHTNKETEFQGIRKEPLKPIKFDSNWDAQEFAKRYKNVENFPVHGNQNYWAQFIQEKYTGKIDWSPEHLIVANVDIEVLMDKGFPEPNRAASEITAITVGVFNGPVYTFSTKKYEGEDTETKIIYCESEKHMLFHFLTKWKEINPHIITGWNVEGFDVPYLINRIRNQIGDEYTSHLAPTARKYTKKCITERDYHGEIEYGIAGISILDYMRLYKKFTFKMRERYSLDFITYTELGERKLDYSEYGNLDDLWEKNPTKYIDYNIRDVRLVERLDKKLNLLMLVYTLSYMAHIRFNDSLSQVLMWDTFIYNKLLEKKIIIPPKLPHDKDMKFEGAWVRDPEIGKHDWVVSFDLDGLYPHLIMQYNISPEMIIDQSEIDDPLMFGIDDLVNGTADLSFLDGMGLTMTANKSFFEKDEQGFLPEMMETLYAQRKSEKVAQLEADSDVEAIKKILSERGVSYDS